MNDFGSIHAHLRQFSKDFSIASLANDDVPAVIRSCIAESDPDGAWRVSPLARQLVFWLQLGMALYRTLSIPNVFAKMMADCRGQRLDFPLRPVTDGALAHARVRLGVAPFKAFFERMAARVRPAPSFHNHIVWAIDGMRITLADQPANEEAFGRPSGSARSGYPQLHLLTLICALSHQVRAATWCRVPPDERGPASELIPYLGPGDLLLMDRGIYAAWMVDDVLKRGCQFLARVSKCVRPIVEHKRSTGDYDVLISPRSGGKRAKRAQRRVKVRARMIEFTVNGERRTILTSLTDPTIKKRELVDLYLERWEVEIANAEFKCRLSPPPRAAAPTHFRGRSRSAVLQELWATLAAYNLVRALMVRGAERAGVPARHISFVDALEVIRSSSAGMTRASTDELPRLYERLIDDLAACAMSRPRRMRTTPRSVKCRNKHYPPRRATHRCAERPPATIKWRAAR